MPIPLILTIDIGSSSLRTNLFDAGAVRLPAFETQLPYETRTTPDGGAEIDPHALSEALFSAIDRTLSPLDTAAFTLPGVGFCSLVSNVLGIDDNGKTTTHIYTWADTRSAPQAQSLRARLDDAHVHDRTGCHLHSSYLPARLLWLREELPAAYARTARWLSLGDYIHLLLFGRCAQSLSVASWSGLLNRLTLDWDDSLLGQIGIPRSALPPLTDAYDGLRGLRPRFAARWPALKESLWLPCLGDGATGNLGSASPSPSEWAVQIGTSSAIRALVPSDVEHVPSGLWCYRLDRHTALIGGALSEGGNLIAWLRDTLHVPDFAALQREAASLPPDSHGLTILPFIAGERSPGWYPSASMHIAGISLATLPTHLLRAAQEAIAFRFAAVSDLLATVLPSPTRIVASGGALLNTLGWMQMLADVLGAPVAASAEEEASSRGAALVALRALGLHSDYSLRPPSHAPTYHPNSTQHASYRAALARQQTLYTVFHKS
jgi:gluconokinase